MLLMQAYCFTFHDKTHECPTCWSTADKLLCEYCTEHQRNGNHMAMASAMAPDAAAAMACSDASGS